MNVPPTLKWSWLCKAGQEVSDNGSSPHRGQTAGAHACPAFSRTRSSCRSSSIPLPPTRCAEHRAERSTSTGQEPTSYTSCLKTEALQAPDFTVWRFPSAEVIPAICPLGALYTMKTNQQNTALFQRIIWSQQLCPFLIGRLNIYVIRKVLKGTETDP